MSLRGSDSASVLRTLCEALTRSALDDAQRAAREHLPLPRITRDRRAYTPLHLIRTAVRDGFVDRYTGARLVFPGTLRLLSILLPQELPYHPNWAYDRCHPVYWELYPTLDHVRPIALGGADAEENWVTTSQRMNSAKSHWTLEELGWKLLPKGEIAQWDGLMGWFCTYTDARPELGAAHKALREWRRVAERARACAARGS